MSNSRYFKYLKNLSEKKFMKIMDLGYMLKQIKEQIYIFQNDINNINNQINDMQKQIKTTLPENKKQLIIEIKALGVHKNDLKNKIDQLVNLMDRQNDGIRVKISRLSLDKMFETTLLGKKGFVDYVSDIAVDSPTLKNNFIKKMNTNYDIPYLSDYAKELSKQVQFEETSGDIFEKMTSLPSFHNRNIPVVQKTLNIDLINDNIKSYLKNKNTSLSLLYS